MRADQVIDAIDEMDIDPRRLLVQVLIDGKWYQVTDIEHATFIDSEGDSHVAVIKAVPA